MAGRQEIRWVGEDGVEPAFGIFGGNGVQQIKAIAVVEPDERGIGLENQSRTGVPPVFICPCARRRRDARPTFNRTIFAEGEMGRGEEMRMAEFGCSRSF